jgi:hypothetical protein
VKRGRAAIFSDTGTGKTRQELEWARLVAAHTGGRVLMLAPLAVAPQTVREGASIGIPVTLCREASDVRDGINITNYDRLHKFNAADFAGVVLDESGCIKHWETKTLAHLLDAFGQTPFKLCASATPAPNDFAELGTHSEFLNVRSRVEMLAEFFVHDGSSSANTGGWRLKGHGRRAFWEWVASWAALLRKPSDLGYENTGYDLPPLLVEHHVLKAEQSETFAAGVLFPEMAHGLTAQRNAKRASMPRRAQCCWELVRDSWIRNRSANTTEPTDLPTSRNSALVVGNGTPRTSSANENERASINLPSQKRRNGKSESVTAPQTETSDAHTCVSATPRSATSSSPAIGSDVPSDQISNEIGTSAPNMESLSSGINGCSQSRTADVPSAENNAGSVWPSITTTQQEKCAASSATSAIAGSGCSPILPTDSSEQWIIWCELNAEADLLADLIPGSVNVQGSDSTEFKERAVLDFVEGRVRVLISKPSIFGWGLNLQCCARVCFVGPSNSYEAYYQSLRRVYRFGQKRAVEAHIVLSEAERSILENLKRKEADAKRMAEELSAATRDAVRANVTGHRRRHNEYRAPSPTWPAWLRGE